MTLLGLLVVLVGVAVWVFFFRGSSSAPAGTDVSAPGSKAEAIDPVIRREFFADERFRNLKIYARLPVEIGSFGRENPFAAIGQ